MIEFHTFRVSDKSFIYFPEYQQAFSVNEKVNNLLESPDPNDLEKKGGLLSRLTAKLVNPQIFDIDEISTRYAFFLMVATTCNSKCIYCFADSGTYGKIEKIMTPEIAVNLKNA
jgi:sulfatase maturation enzyme AslB (radical SAM superfamily)